MSFKKYLLDQQLLPVFLLPLVIAIPNSSFILTALAQFAHLKMLLPFLGTIIVYFIIYMGYYLLTVRKYNRIVNM